MRVVVTQMGARRGYAVPLILEQAGMLERFYTDLAGNVGAGMWLAKCGRFLGCRKAAAVLQTRQVPAQLRAKTFSFPLRTCWHALQSWSCAEPKNRFRRQLQWTRNLGLAVVKKGFGNATHFYTMLGEAGPATRAASERGLTVVTEVYIQLSTERILARERSIYPDWEGPGEDLDEVRSEFPEQTTWLKGTDYAICPSIPVREDLETNFGFPSQRSKLVPYGVDAGWFKLRSRPIQGRVLFVGTAGLRKGIHYLASAAARLHEKGRHYEFRVAGDAPREVTRNDLSRHLRFLGRLRRTELALEFERADVFAFPTLAEGSAEVTYQAMAMGLPLVTTKASGTVAEDGKDALLVPERDAAELAAGIERIVEDRNLRNRMSKEARNHALDFTTGRYGQRLKQALLEIAHDRRNHGRDPQPMC